MLFAITYLFEGWIPTTLDGSIMVSSQINFDIGSPSHPNGCDDEDYHGTPNNEGEDDGIQEMLNDFENLRDHVWEVVLVCRLPLTLFAFGLHHHNVFEAHSVLDFVCFGDVVLTPCAHCLCRECLLASWRTPTSGLCSICRKAITRQDLITAPTDSRFTVDVEKD
ncbi:hypothetical protein Pint_35903 [Pistacia integerrima]|uniref:Uncharacterized protein n=1 Tax=Pistacia integerrima TaxID=434235 RepID=A0ACC0Y083_9ROSI|nr:hypothetical protein Pint_35903 [Pistacia integerrima]